MEGAFGGQKNGVFRCFSTPPGDPPETGVFAPPGISGISGFFRFFGSAGPGVQSKKVNPSIFGGVDFGNFGKKNPKIRKFVPGAKNRVLGGSQNFGDFDFFEDFGASESG